MILVVNKIDRPDARVAEVVHEVEELFLDLDADEHQIDFPILYANAREGQCGTLDRDALGADLEPLFATLARAHPRARVRGRPSAAGARHEPRRLALRRAGSRSAGSARDDHARASRSPGAGSTARSRQAKITELYVTDALDRVEADEAGPGRDRRGGRHRRGHDRRDARRSRRPAAAPGHARRRAVAVDDDRRSTPRRSAGTDGDKVTARLLKTRLDQEVVGNVSIRVRRHRAPRDVGGAGPRRAAARGARRDDAARGLRAHGRQAAGRDPHGRTGSCTSRWSASRSTRPRTTSASISQLLALRKGRMEHMVNHGTGLDPDGVPGAGARADRVPHRVHDRDARHRPAPPRVRGVRALARRAPDPPERLARRRPPRDDDARSRC